MLKNQADEPMPVDETQMRYKCPYCMNLEGSKKLVRKHITETEDGKHRKKNGHTMEETIEAVELKENYTDLDWKISKALERFDNVGNEEIKKIAERADVDWGRVAWVAEKEGYDLGGWKGHSPRTSPEELSDSSIKVLQTAARYGIEKEDGKLYPDVNVSISQLEDKMGLSNGAWRYSMDRYGWMVEKDMADPLPEDKLNMEDEETEEPEETEEEMGQEEETEEDQNKENRTISVLLDQAGVDIETKVVVKEPKIDAIEKLLENDDKETAEKVMDGEVDFE